MAPPRANASYKKQSGLLAISRDRKALSWSPASPPDASPTVVISVQNVENLQQTPETAPKVMLKVFDKVPGQSDTVAHTFTFTSTTNAREECNAIRNEFAKAIQDHKAEQNARAGGTGGGKSAAMTMANAVSGNTWEDDEKLKTDVRLQQSLMAEDRTLQKTFLEARSLKPDSITMTQFTQQFWSSRLHLLRAHSLSKHQGRGRFNVFSVIDVKDGGRRMDITTEHINAIFEQYPVVARIYDELVPRKIKDELTFWSRFFQSRLYHTLRGMKITKTDAPDDLLDSYLNRPGVSGAVAASTSNYIPKFIDLEGNEENNSQRKGNKERFEQNEEYLNRAPVIRRLNAISEKLVAAVRPSETDASAPIGLDEAEYEALRLRDLAADPEQNRTILNIRDQSHFFADADRDPDPKSKGKGKQVDPYRAQDPARALQTVLSDIRKNFPQPGVGTIPTAPIHEYDEDDEEESQPDGSTAATNHILNLIQTHKDQTAPIPATSGLSSDLYDRLALTHATTIEFLRQFWSAFLSGDAARVNEVAALVESLNRALERINAIADDAQKEKKAVEDKAKADMEEIYRKTGRKKRLVEVGGGGKVVRELMTPVLGSLERAIGEYKRAFEEQSRAVAGEGQ
jgi:transcription initiation factor TFIIH subunit 1